VVPLSAKNGGALNRGGPFGRSTRTSYWPSVFAMTVITPVALAQPE
jgi:hypothetical protein